MAPSPIGFGLQLPNPDLAVGQFIGFEIDGMEAVRRIPPKYRAAAQVIFPIAMKESMRLLLIDLIPRIPVDEGKALGSIKPKTTVVNPTMPWLMGEVGSDSDYMGNLEFGRPAGARMPPIDALEAWALRKFGEEGLGYTIAKGISINGIDGHHMFEKTYEAMTPVIHQLWDRAVDKVIDAAVAGN